MVGRFLPSLETIQSTIYSKINANMPSNPKVLGDVNFEDMNEPYAKTKYNAKFLIADSNDEERILIY
jgi:hypothetical protein